MLQLSMEFQYSSRVGSSSLHPLTQFGRKTAKYRSLAHASQRGSMLMGHLAISLKSHHPTSVSKSSKLHRCNRPAHFRTFTSCVRSETSARRTMKPKAASEVPNLVSSTKQSSTIHCMDTLRSLHLAPGIRHCVHVPPEHNAYDIATAMASVTLETDDKIIVATYPNPNTFFSRLFGLPSVSTWLARELDCSVEQAKSEIDRLPVRVDERFNCNAYNPMRFIGVLIALHAQPSVLIYETSGMDPRGRQLLNEFALRENTDGTLVHVTSLPVAQCERSEQCVVVNMQN